MFCIKIFIVLHEIHIINMITENYFSALTTTSQFRKIEIFVVVIPIRRKNAENLILYMFWPNINGSPFLLGDRWFCSWFLIFLKIKLPVHKLQIHELSRKRKMKLIQLLYLYFLFLTFELSLTKKIWRLHKKLKGKTLFPLPRVKPEKFSSYPVYICYSGFCVNITQTNCFIGIWKILQ